MPLASNAYFDLINIDGQTQAVTSISSAVIGGVDGDTVNNVQAHPRTLILDLRIKSGVDVERAKRYILQTVKVKQKASLVWTQNERTVTISGIVESIDMPRWYDGVTMQISMHCEQPFWEDIDFVVQEISEAIDRHYFTSYQNDMLYFPAAGIPLGEIDTTRTKRFANDGDVSVGIEITINALDTVTNPIIYAENGDFFGIGYGTGAKKLVMESGDVAKITTHKGNKAVSLNGINLFDKIKPNSTWLQLAPGENLFSVQSDDGSISNMYFNLTYKQRYV